MKSIFFTIFLVTFCGISLSQNSPSRTSVSLCITNEIKQSDNVFLISKSSLKNIEKIELCEQGKKTEAYKVIAYDVMGKIQGKFTEWTGKGENLSEGAKNLLKNMDLDSKIAFKITFRNILTQKDEELEIVIKTIN